MTNIQGRSANKRCICVPIDDSGLILGTKGVYMNAVAIEMKNSRFNDTHCVKMEVPKEQRETMTEEEREATPIIGGLHPIERKTEQMNVDGNIPVIPEDCPF